MKKLVATIHFESDEGSIDNWEELIGDRLDGMATITDVHVEEVEQ